MFTKTEWNPVTGLTLRIGTSYSHENDFYISSFGKERLRRLYKILDSHPSNEIISRGVAYDEKDNGSDFEERSFDSNGINNHFDEFEAACVVSESDVGAGEDDKHFSSQTLCCRFVKNIHFLMIAYFIVFPFVTVQFVLQGKAIHLNAFVIVVIGGDDDNDEGDVDDDDDVVLMF
jgi:hypothetical protein